MAQVPRAAGGGLVGTATLAPSMVQVRLWPGAPPAGRGGVVAAAPQLVRYPTPTEHDLVADTLTALGALRATDKPAAAFRRVAEAAKPLEVCVDALVGHPLSEMIAALRGASWLSPALASTSVVVVSVAAAAPVTAAVPFVAAMPGLAHSALVMPGSTYAVYEVFFTTPCALYRTVLQNQTLPCVLAANGGNAFSVVSPIAAAVFSLGELDTGQSVFSAALTGLSLAREHEGTRHPPLRQQLPPLAPAEAAILLVEALDRSAARPFGVACDLDVLPASAAPHGFPVAPLVPSNGSSRSQALFCYELPGGTDLAAIGFCAIFDNSSPERLGHFSVQRLGPLAVVPWVMDATQVLSRSPAAVPAPPASAEVFNFGAAWMWAAPVLASRFKMHCFVIRGRAGYTHLDADEPGADVDVADALEVCAGLSASPDHDCVLLALLEDCMAARYSPARMDNSLRVELANALESAALEELTPGDARAVARGAARLCEWIGDGTCSILQYASGPGLRDAAGLPVGDAKISVPLLCSLLRDFLDAPVDRMLEVLSEAVSSAPRARALLSGSTRVRVTSPAVAAERRPPSDRRLSHLLSALEAPRVTVHATQVHSTELLLHGLPLAEMAGIMCDLEDPLAQRILLASALLAVGQPASDTPVFVFAAPAPPAAAAPPSVRARSARAPSVPTCGLPGASARFEALVAPKELLQFARFFRAATRPLALALLATKVAEHTLDDVSRKLWGLPAGLSGSFFMVMGDRALSVHVALHAQLLRDCASAAGFNDAVIDVAAGTLRAQPDEVLFVLLTSSRRTFVYTPALVVQLLRVHGFPDARVGSAWESGQSLLPLH